MVPLQLFKTMTIAFFGLIFVVSGGYAWGLSQKLVDGKTGEERSLEQFLETIPIGSVVLLGEQHVYQIHQDQQLQVLVNSQERGHLVSVGMEFFNYPDQKFIEPWQKGEMTESEFLKNMNWGAFPFTAYKPQLLVPRLGKEFVQALNAPRTLTSKVAQQGLESLDSDEKNLLPPQFEIGNQRYFERFKAATGGHMPEEKLKNYFIAQSIWDDTMAWQAVEFQKNHPEQTLFIIVGEFHVQYGGGLPDRLKKRGVKKLVSLSLVNLEGLSPAEESEAMAPSPLDGPRADFIWASRPDDLQQRSRIEKTSWLLELIFQK